MKRKIYQVVSGVKQELFALIEKQKVWLTQANGNH